MVDAKAWFIHCLQIICNAKGVRGIKRQCSDQTRVEKWGEEATNFSLILEEVDDGEVFANNDKILAAVHVDWRWSRQILTEYRAPDLQSLPPRFLADVKNH